MSLNDPQGLSAWGEDKLEDEQKFIGKERLSCLALGAGGRGSLDAALS